MRIVGAVRMLLLLLFVIRVEFCFLFAAVVAAPIRMGCHDIAMYLHLESRSSVNSVVVDFVCFCFCLPLSISWFGLGAVCKVDLIKCEKIASRLSQ